ncbi:MmpS family transport accessory protein [Nocardia sp. NPDC020380]|uniref:MmpS family transport accessory protein n=1 Tax=Nocardia sp. NPDC020380 TaxID=3364309 RepID=UPI00378AB5FD
MTMLRCAALAVCASAVLLSAGAGISSADDSHQVLYEAWGTGTNSANQVGYVGGNGTDIQQETNVSLPWSKTVTSSSLPVWNMVAQNATDNGSISCRITVDGVVRDTETATGGYSMVTCAVTPQ